MKALIARNKLLIILLTLLAAAAGVAVFLFVRSGYRTVQVYDLEGQTEIQRGSGRLNANSGMRLENGDHIQTFSDSWLYLKMDDDKYMLAEPETSFLLDASGTKKKSQTHMNLETGALISHVTKPLNEAASYEITTPNSVVAVRGSSLRVFVWNDEYSISHTLLQVFEGIAEVRLRYPGGSISEESRQIRPGQTVTIWGDSRTSDYDGIEDKIDYLRLKIPTLEFLKLGITEARPDSDFDITIQEIDELTALKESRYNVTFMVGDEVFGTQTVQYGDFANPPKLMPSEAGMWDFDFTTPITQDAVIHWW